MENSKRTGTIRDKIEDLATYFWPFLAAFFVVKIVQFVLYPDPYIMSDTGDYLKSALLLKTNPFKPIGYSLYLAFNRLILPFPLGVPLLHCALKLAATFGLGVVLKRYYPLPRWSVLTICTAVALNPTALLMDHYLISDSLFASCTIGMIAALLAYARTHSWRSVVVALALALASASIRFVGVVYPVLVLALVFLYGPKRGWIVWAQAALVPVATAALLYGMAAKTRHDLDAFKVTTFDGWAFHGTIGHLIADNPWDLQRIEDPEARLVCQYVMSFPLEKYKGRLKGFFRWHSESPAKNLLRAFLPITKRPDDLSAARDSTFIVDFLALSGKMKSPAQKLFQLYRNKTNPNYPPYAMNYWGSFIVTNELLRGSNREFMAQHRWAYLTQFFPVSLGELFLPTSPPISKGKYTYRESADFQVSEFWRGHDSSTWRPRFTDVGGALNWTHQIFVVAMWLVALAALVWALLRRRSLEVTWLRLVTGFGVSFLAFAVLFGAATAYSHMMEVRYTCPLVPFVLVAAAFLYSSPGSPWSDAPD
jgi:hypothetical protein